MLKRVTKPLVYVKFYDHCSDNAVDVKPIICELFGILKTEDDICFTIVTWITASNLGDHNSDAYCILKSAVIEYRVLDIGDNANGKSSTKRPRERKEVHKPRNKRNGRI